MTEPDRNMVPLAALRRVIYWTRPDARVQAACAKLYVLLHIESPNTQDTARETRSPASSGWGRVVFGAGSH